MASLTAGNKVDLIVTCVEHPCQGRSCDLINGPLFLRDQWLRKLGKNFSRMSTHSSHQTEAVLILNKLFGIDPLRLEPIRIPAVRGAVSCRGRGGLSAARGVDSAVRAAIPRSQIGTPDSGQMMPDRLVRLHVITDPRQTER